jgi:hypothetical protein
MEPALQRDGSYDDDEDYRGSEVLRTSAWVAGRARDVTISEAGVRSAAISVRHLSNPKTRSSSLSVLLVACHVHVVSLCLGGEARSTTPPLLLLTSRPLVCTQLCAARAKGEFSLDQWKQPELNPKEETPQTVAWFAPSSDGLLTIAPALVHAC